MPKRHHYAFDAAALLDECIEQLQLTIDMAKTQRHDFLFDLKESLVTTECLLHAYFLQLLEIESHVSDAKLPTSLSLAVSTLRAALEEKSRIQHASATSTTPRKQSKARPSRHRRQETPFPLELTDTKLLPKSPIPNDITLDSNAMDASWVQAEQSLTESSKEVHCYYPSRNATDTLLFRLIVALQLCLLRIDDARFIITGRRRGNKVLSTNTTCLILVGVSVLGTGATLLLRRPRDSSCHFLRSFAKLSARAGILVLGAAWARSSWNKLWISNKMNESAASIEEWQKQWLVVQSTSDSSNDLSGSKGMCSSSLDSKSRRLIEYALKEHPRTSFWHSHGELRFLMLKRAMDIFYASVGTAVEAFQTTDEAQQTSTWQIPLASAAVASFYALTGGSERASQAIKSSAKDLIQNAWGMVSLPAIKRLSLEASKLLKGAAVADRINIAGVSCFVLSRDPSPELSAALKRFHRKERRRTLSRLYTIDEVAESASTPKPSEAAPKSHKCGCSSRQLAGVSGRYHPRDVIFHLTGGGFFAHIIASDLPYLLDWSARTGAVVICPEYALLPEYAFPVALNQVADVYSSLLSGGAVQKLGFEVNRIVVTGESAGGNLAAALCVKLAIQRQESLLISQGSSDDTDGFQDVEVAVLEDVNRDAVILESDSSQRDSDSISTPRLPDALMLSCAVLNLTLELTHSRVVGTQDPVLPSGLISVISDAYIPTGGQDGCNKKNPLASPFFAPDELLQWFPPTLLFASSNDPLLDDSVHFNQRLLRLGVESELRAAVNLPHAYWGLGTAGFPEAQQVQMECQDWLVHQLTRERL